MFGEHGGWSHAGSLYEEVVRVPLLMRYSGGISPGLAITTPVQTMDLMPTILDYAGITLPVNIQAITLRPLIPATSKLYQLQFTSPYETDNVVDQEMEKYQRLRWAVINRFFPNHTFLPIEMN